MKKGIQIHVTFTDGELLSSDRTNWEELVRGARKEDSRATEDQIEHVVEQLVELFSKVGTMETMNIVCGGQSHSINPRHVKYIKIERV